MHGPDSDLAAVSVFEGLDDSKLYGFAAQKSEMLWMFEIQNGRTIFAK